MSSSGKVPVFLGVCADPCVFGKCLTDTWIKCKWGGVRGQGGQQSSKYSLSLVYPVRRKLVSVKVPSRRILDTLFEGNT